MKKLTLPTTRIHAVLTAIGAANMKYPHALCTVAMFIVMCNDTSTTECPAMKNKLTM
eukprot:CAMPEP_0198550048 /NCGR_PEP_ID=MMETSP1462-20131121/73954_1 /TAXON_ID=1333877 /ORGANISM="Brandtodinium nutriculum, Strain RCC3387" /LENGTH=56 /DNA_ID=CAMNT_0044280645 /DNA_START=6 /DNA_END=176 /DNA_ORIENTATION=-